MSPFENGKKSYVNDDILIEKLQKLAVDSNKIEPEYYNKYDVKRGLRNNDGTGVLVGLTGISDVHGYIFKNGVKKPAEGCLYYRGIDVADIIKNCEKEDRFGFEETCFLLLFGKLPNKYELDQFTKILSHNRPLPEGFFEDMILKAPSSDIMNKLARSVLASYSYDDNPEDITAPGTLKRSIRLIAQFPTFVAYAFQAKMHYYYEKSLYIHTPKENQSTAESFLRMIRPNKKFTHEEARALDLALILHAEHGGGNNSSFATRVVSSSGTDIYSAIAAGVGSLKGPKHGGASIKVMEMIGNIKANVTDWEDESKVKDYLVKILKKEAFDKSGLIYGMGHAVYTLSDPRAKILKDQAFKLAKSKDEIRELKLYNMIEKLTPELFREIKKEEKTLCANVDLYSGFVYKMLGIPADLHTPIFAIARIPGWCAHRIEELISGGRIIRPAYRSLFNHKEYVPLDERD